MKKSLIALAVAGAFVAPAAMADTGNVTIYGSADMAVQLVKSGDATAPAASGTSTTQISGVGSALGFKGKEDLGGGTSAMFQIETGIALDGTGGQTWATNDSFVGLTGDSWGTVLLGQHDSPYKMAFRSMDLFDTTLGDNRNIMGGGLDQRLGHVLAYVTPAMSGFTAAVAYVPSLQPIVTSAAIKGNGWSLAGMYGAGPINAAIAYQEVKLGDAGFGGYVLGSAPGSTFFTNALTGVANDKAKAWKIGGGYTMDMFQVNLEYEKLTATRAVGTEFNQSNYYLSGKYNVSASDAIKVAYTHAGNPSGTPAVVNGDAKQYSFGYDHSMSKRTTVYALYTKLTNNGSAASNANYALFTGDGVTTNTTTTGFGSNPSAFELGIKHNF